MNEMMSADMAADEKGISAETVRRWCRTGKVDGAERVGKQWRFTRGAWEAALLKLGQEYGAKQSSPKSNGLALSC